MKKGNKVSQNVIRPKHDLILKPKISFGIRELRHPARREEEKEKEKKRRRRKEEENQVWNYLYEIL